MNSSIENEQGTPPQKLGSASEKRNHAGPTTARTDEMKRQYSLTNQNHSTAK
jgi:hypothetical protein